MLQRKEKTYPNINQKITFCIYKMYVEWRLLTIISLQTVQPD